MASESVNRPLTLAILDVYFDEVVGLRNYLKDILVFPSAPEGPANQNVDDILLQEGDSEEYTELLNTSVIGLKPIQTEPRPRFAPVPPLMYMRDVLQFYICDCHGLRLRVSSRSSRKLTRYYFWLREPGRITLSPRVTSV